MKNKTLLPEERYKKVPAWLWEEGHEDDFLSGHVPQDLTDTFEEEE